jgi:ABC-2 type transport system ATP-binding protein
MGMMLRLENVCQKTDGTWDASRGIGIIGRAHAGKTTLAKLLAGVNAPREGRVFWGEKGESPLKHKMKERISFFSGEMRIPSYLTATRLAKYLAQTYREWDGETFKQLLQAFAIDSQVKIKNLDSGQALFIGFLAAICCRPEVMIFDELFAKMDQEEFKGAKKLLLDSMNLANVGLVLLTDDPQYIEGLCQDIIVLEAGKLACHFALDRKRDSFKKLHVIPRRDFDLEEFNLRGVIKVELERERVSIITSGNMNYIRESLALGNHQIVETAPLTFAQYVWAKAAKEVGL